METSTQNVNLADYYYGFLKRLSKESKIDLIERLVQSLKEEETEHDIPEIASVEAFFEAFKSDVTATQILEEIRALKNYRLNNKSNQSNGAF